MLRTKARARDASARIESPLVRYNELDQPVCRVCQTVVRSSALWAAHLKSAAHREQVLALKQKKQNASAPSASHSAHTAGANHFAAPTQGQAVPSPAAGGTLLTLSAPSSRAAHSQQTPPASLTQTASFLPSKRSASSTNTSATASSGFASTHAPAAAASSSASSSTSLNHSTAALSSASSSSASSSISAAASSSKRPRIQGDTIEAEASFGEQVGDDEESGALPSNFFDQGQRSSSTHKNAAAASSSVAARPVVKRSAEATRRLDEEMAKFEAELQQVQQVYAEEGDESDGEGELDEDEILSLLLDKEQREAAVATAREDHDALREQAEQKKRLQEIKEARQRRREQAAAQAAAADRGFASAVRSAGERTSSGGGGGGADEAEDSEADGSESEDSDSEEEAEFGWRARGL